MVGASTSKERTWDVYELVVVLLLYHTCIVVVVVVAVAVAVEVIDSSQIVCVVAAPNWDGRRKVCKVMMLCI